MDPSPEDNPDSAVESEVKSEPPDVGEPLILKVPTADDTAK